LRDFWFFIDLADRRPALRQLALAGMD